jgi:hypothetical protein
MSVCFPGEIGPNFKKLKVSIFENSENNNNNFKIEAPTQKRYIPQVCKRNTLETSGEDVKTTLETSVKKHNFFFKKNQVGDIIVGIVLQKSADFYRLDINSVSTAILPSTAFNSATKRHKPVV